MRVRPLSSLVIMAGVLLLACPPVHAASGVRWDPGTATDIVEYECTTDGVTEKQNIKVRVEMRMPADATVDVQMVIGWRGSYAEGTALTAPAAGLTGVKLYAYASISDMPGLTSATGVGELPTVGANETIPLPQTEVELRTTARNAGTATVKPAAINVGPRPTDPLIECEVLNSDDLRTYPLEIGGAAQPTDSASTTPTPTPSASETPTDTDAQEDGNARVTRTPAGAAETGGGGETGPDGRVFVLTGLALMLAGVTGLLLRRRSVPRG